MPFAGVAAKKAGKIDKRYDGDGLYRVTDSYEVKS
jgi:hypothetical protein